MTQTINLNIAEFWQEQTRHHMEIAEKTFPVVAEPLEKWVEIAVSAIKSGKKLLFCGNGGSAADAQHISAELSVKLCQDREPIAAICLSLDPSAMTACANDYGYDQVFARQVAAFGQEGDVLIGITTSGNSKNVMEAIEVAKKKGIKVVVLTGESGGKVAPLADLAIKVPCSDSTARIQEMHILLGHAFCGALENRLGLV
ncbi:MAG: D-sedoheptulose 7-phosphate isomerase [Pseudobdellovibrionaceae bacterium]|jgi:D-sedoheptulose 7-phosphate isomerase|nr:D-sedoheptulose 7-phosphate isomerase [Pseudobdellovibrionaceae bacterium]